MFNAVSIEFRLNKVADILEILFLDERFDEIEASILEIFSLLLCSEDEKLKERVCFGIANVIKVHKFVNSLYSVCFELKLCISPLLCIVLNSVYL